MFGTLTVRPAVYNRLLPQLSSLCNGHFNRLQLVRLKNSGQNELQNEKLRQIIESSNFGSHAIKKQQQNAEQHFEQLKVAPSTEKAETSSVKSNTATEIPQKQSVSDIQNTIQQNIEGLPSQVEKARSQMAKAFERYLDSVQDTLFTATRALNDITGYSAIEKLKLSITELETELKDAKDKVKECKKAYSDAIERRSLLQKEVNELLTRKHDWTSEDLERFADLYRNDHVNEKQEATSQEELTAAELAVDAVQLRLTQLILTRYHEEQIWSDKIRRASTWGTWIIMGVNLLLFALAAFVVEPWKRRRLVGSFEAKVKQALDEFVAERDAQTAKTADLTNKKAAVAVSTDLEPEAAAYVENDGVTLGLQDSLHGLRYWLGWNAITARIGQIYASLFSKGSSPVQLERAEVGALSVVLALGGCLAGSLLTAYLK